MSSSVCMVNADGQVPDKKVKVENDAEDGIKNTEGKMESFFKRIRKRAPTGPEVERPTSGKRVKVTTQAGEHLLDSTSDDGSRSCSQGHRLSPQEQSPISSYRKPLYSITHRISERKAASSLEQNGAHNGLRANHNGVHFQQLGNSRKHHMFKASPTVGVTGSPAALDSHLYPLIEKMFFLLNTLNSSMTQLHSKVDLLSLEVTRIKKQLKPSEMIMEFQPPPEYQLTSDELTQLTGQTSTAGELGCRLLVQLFPELFTTKECAHGCSTCSLSNKRTLDSLHLQLIRNYVEVCYPLVKNENVWQTECLLQINDFLNRFWAQKDMESGQVHDKQAPMVAGLDMELNHSCHFISEDAQDESLSLNSGENNDVHPNNVSSDGVFDPHEAAGDDSEDLTSPEELVIFLLNRLFPEVFEEGKLPEGHSSIGQLITDSDRLEIIRKYMEANFPDIPEETWLPLCIQRMEEALESTSVNESGRDNQEMYDITRLPDNISIVKISDLCDYEKPNRRSKKSWLEPVDFDTLEIPPPDFDIPQEYLLSKEQLKNNYECSLSIGNFASRLLVLMFPELFTNENARKYYNCSGSLGKKQLDPVRIHLIRHYVQLLYPQAKNDRVWTLEFVGKLDERCRRRDTDQRRSYQQQRKACSPDQEPDLKDSLLTAGQVSVLTSDRLKEDFEVLSSPLEKSSKDFCKIPLEDLSVSTPDFPVPSDYLLTDAEVREIVQQSLSVGNFAARLLVRLFPELFTQENLRLQYNHSGACNKKQLDPVRLRLIRHYVEAVYPVDKMEEVWHYECVPSIDERCRRPNRKKCDILKKAKRSNNTVTYS